MLRGVITGWAALGVVLTGATQLRPAAVPVGPGELLLLSWIVFVIFLLLRGLSFNSGTVFRLFLVYWLSSTTLLGLGALVAISTSRIDPAAAQHDSFALLFAAVLSCLLTLGLRDSDGDYHTRLARAVFLLMAFSSTLLLATAMALPSLGVINFWWDYRFRGWAENPNQMALLVLGMPFLGWYLLRRARRLWRKIVYALAIGGCVWVGWATASDGLRVAWAATLVGLGVLTWYRAVFRARGAVMYLSHLVVPIVVVSLGYAFGDELVARLEEVSQATYEEGDQGSIRMTLWRHGLDAIAHSPLVGFGPGSYSGLFRPFQGKEAHSMFIDWGMSTGVLGVLLHLGLLTWIGWRALKSNSLALLGPVVSLMVFGTFAYPLRQPIYWLLLVLALALAEQQRGRAEARRPVPAPAPRFASNVHHVPSSP